VTSSDDAAILPPRNGAAASLARLVRERGLSADIRTHGRTLVLTVRNPAVPLAKLSQQVALARDDNGGEVFVWLFEGAQRGAWETELLGPASEIEAAASRLAHVLAVEDQDRHGG
jgi:hypothetical protein